MAKLLMRALLLSVLVCAVAGMTGCGEAEDVSAITTDEIINGKRSVWKKVSEEQRLEACRSILEQVGQTGVTTPEDLATCVTESLEKEALSKVIKVAANCLL